VLPFISISNLGVPVIVKLNGCETTKSRFCPSRYVLSEGSFIESELVTSLCPENNPPPVSSYPLSKLHPVKKEIINIKIKFKAFKFS
jgi:hypothetical protein